MDRREIQSMRRLYSERELALPEDPIEAFKIWLKEAAELPSIIEANAMVLSTTGAEGFISTRSVLLKDVSEAGEHSQAWMDELKALAHKMAPQDKLRQAHQERMAQDKERAQQALQKDIENLPNNIVSLDISCNNGFKLHFRYSKGHHYLDYRENGIYINNDGFYISSQSRQLILTNIIYKKIKLIIIYYYHKE